MQRIKEIMTQILDNEQVGRKLLLKGQLQMVIFVEVLKPKDPTRLIYSIGGSI
jgi:hypothetical protein